VILFRFKYAINDGDVKIEFSGKLGFELDSFKLDHHIAVEPHVIKKQVKEELITGDLQAILTSDVGKTGSQLQ
jgi:hypothetical protein